MWTENTVFQEDLNDICSDDVIPWEDLRGKRILITGATGLIGYAVVSTLLYYDCKHAAGIEVVALVRDLERAREKFSAQLSDGCNLSFVVGSVENRLQVSGSVDYIIHCACPTASKFFVSNPVDTMHTIIDGTENILRLAQEKNACGIVYLSSMEVFGEVTTKVKLKERDLGYIDLYSPRSSYSEGKRFAESLCCAYANQYRLPVTVVRLAQTFGPGVAYRDERVFAYMARCAMHRENIRLNTDGSKENGRIHIRNGDVAEVCSHDHVLL